MSVFWPSNKLRQVGFSPYIIQLADQAYNKRKSGGRLRRLRRLCFTAAVTSALSLLSLSARVDKRSQYNPVPRLTVPAPTGGRNDTPWYPVTIPGFVSST